MEEQQRIQPLKSNKNGKESPSLPMYVEKLQENHTEEWDLRKLLAVIRRRAVVIGSVAITIFSTVCFSTFSREATYEGKFQLLVEPVTAETELKDLTQNSDTASTLEQGLDYETQIQVLLSPKLMEPIIKQISVLYPDTTYQSLVPNLTITQFQETKILEVSYQDAEPQKIQFVLRQLAQGYLKYSLEERQTNLNQGTRFVDSQQPILQAQVNGLQTQLQRFRQKHNFFNPESKAEQTSEQVSGIKLQRLDTQKELAEARALSATLQSQNGTVEALKGAPVYQKLIEELRDVDSQIAAGLAKFQEDNPTIQALRQKRQNLVPILQQETERVLGNKRVEVANQISGLEVRMAELVQAENRLNQQLKQLPTLARQYTDLQRELTIATESLNRFLEKRQSLQVETAQKEIPWELIVAPEVPQQPISPNVKRNLILGAITGLLAGMGAALLAERLDNVFHSLDELKDLTKLPVLGLIPVHKRLKQIAPLAEANIEKKPNGYRLVFPNLSTPQDENDFIFLEAFRSLQTNIGFLGSSDTPIKSLVVSSSLHAEGKSTVAVHLAQASAAMGQRVLLVDADLRLPQIHNLLNLSNEPGLSNVISTNLSVSEVIQRSPLSDNLFVLTSGYIPPDPTKLLAAKKTKKIMEQLRQQFDLIIYDMPPLLGLADSSIIASYTDGVVLVVRMGKTARSALIQALDSLNFSGITVLGTVCNGIKTHNVSPYNYYHHSSTHKVGITSKGLEV